MRKSILRQQQIVLTHTTSYILEDISEILIRILSERATANNLQTSSITEIAEEYRSRQNNTTTAGRFVSHNLLNLNRTKGIVIDNNIVESKSWVIIIPIPCLITSETDILQVGTISEESHLSIVHSIHLPLINYLAIEVHFGIFAIKYCCIVVPLLISQPVSIIMVKLILAIYVLNIRIVSPTIIINLKNTTILTGKHRHTIIGVRSCTIGHKERSPHIISRSTSISCIYPNTDSHFLCFRRMRKGITWQ